MRAFFYSAARLQLLGGTAFITQTYNHLCGQGLCLVHLSAKGKASKNRLWGVERETIVALKRTLSSSGTSALPGDGSLGSRGKEKWVPPRG